MAQAAHDLALLSPAPEEAPALNVLGSAALDLLSHPALRRLGEDVAPAPIIAAATPALRARSLKEKTAAGLTPRVSQRTHVETIVAEVQSHDELSTMPPTQPSKPQGRLQRFWSRLISMGKKIITLPVRLFRRKS